MHNQNQSGVEGRNFITNILQTVVLSFLIIEREYEKKWLSFVQKVLFVMLQKELSVLLVIWYNYPDSMAFIES